MRNVFQRDGFTEQQAAERIKAIVSKYPDTARFAADLFTKDPSSTDDLQRRTSMFNTIWELNKTIEMPQVVQRVATEAKAAGIEQAKIDAKRGLTTVSGGDLASRETSREDRIRAAVDGGSDSDYAKLLLEGPMFRNM